MLTSRQQPKLFICYSSKNYDIAMKLYRALEQLGVSVWIDKRGIKVGRMWRREIDTALKSSTHLLYLHSNDAFDSDRVWEEWGYALDTKKQVLPLILENTELPYPFTGIHHIPFYKIQLHHAVKLILKALGLPVPPHDPNDPTHSGKIRIKEKVTENGVSDHSTSDYLHESKNNIPELFHLFVMPLSSLSYSIPTEPTATPDTDKVIKQAEEIVNRAFVQGTRLLPSDLEHLQITPTDFEIEDTSKILGANFRADTTEITEVTTTTTSDATEESSYPEHDPVRDADGDGISDASDSCPWRGDEYGFGYATDGDGIPDTEDACPWQGNENELGVGDNDCPLTDDTAPTEAPTITPVCTQMIGQMKTEILSAHNWDMNDLNMSHLLPSNPDSRPIMFSVRARVTPEAGQQLGGLLEAYPILVGINWNTDIPIT